MSITVDLPSDLETALQIKAQNQGLSMSDFLLYLARKEAESGSYTDNEIQNFLDADILPAELSAKVERLLGR